MAASTARDLQARPNQARARANFEEPTQDSEPGKVRCPKRISGAEGAGKRSQIRPRAARSGWLDGRVGFLRFCAAKMRNRDGRLALASYLP